MAARSPAPSAPSTTATPSTQLINDRREIFGWSMYRFANTAFSTTVAVVFLGPYLAWPACWVCPSRPTHFCPTASHSRSYSKLVSCPFWAQSPTTHTAANN